MHLPDLSRLAQAPTSVLVTMDEWEREDRGVAAVGGNPSPPSDDEDGDDSEQGSSPAGGSAIRRLYIGLHAGGNHDAEGFLIMAMKVAGKALLTVPVASWGKKITEMYGNSYGFEGAVKVKLETWFKQDIGVAHFDEYVAGRCEASASCDTAEAERFALTFKIMFALQPMLADAPAVRNAMKGAIDLLVASYQKDISSGYLESDTEPEAPAAPPALPDPPPNPNDALVVLGRFTPVLGKPWLDSHDTYVVRSDPRMAAGFALFCYKKSWDKPLAYAYRGVPVAQYLKALGPLQDDQKDARVPGLLAFLPLRMLRKLATEYVRGPAQEISQVLPAHRADDYSIRASANASPQLQAWAQGADVQPRLTKLLDALPPDGIKLRPVSRGDECNLRFDLDASKWGPRASEGRGEAVALIHELRTRSHEEVGYNVTEKGHVYPLYNCARSVLETSQSETCYTGRASAQLLLGACIERMLASLDPLMSRVGETGDKTWRGVRKGRYGWVEAAGDDDELWAARLIETLQATYFSVSTEERVARRGYFLGSGGILIELQGACRGVRAVDTLTGPWACYGHEAEILVAPHQTFTVLKPRKKNQTVNGVRNISTITLEITSTSPHRKPARWVDDGVDPHWSRE